MKICLCVIHDPVKGQQKVTVLHVNVQKVHGWTDRQTDGWMDRWVRLFYRKSHPVLLRCFQLLVLWLFILLTCFTHNIHIIFILYLLLNLIYSTEQDYIGPESRKEKIEEKKKYYLECWRNIYACFCTFLFMRSGRG